MRAAVAMAILIAVTPMAAASSVHGDLSATGVTLPEAGKSTLDPIALWQSNTSAVAELTLTASRLHLVVYQEDYAETRTPAAAVGMRTLPLDREEINATDATIALIPGDHTGWLAIDFPSMPGPLDVSGSAHHEARAETTLGNSIFSSDPASPEGSYNYARKINEPHGYVTTRGSIGYTGSGRLLLVGPDFAVKEDAQTTSLTTGTSRSGPDAANSKTVRWAFVEFEEGTLLMSPARDVEIVASSATATWDGTVVLSTLEGQLQDGTRTYAATGGPVTLTGSMQLTATPSAAAQPFFHLRLTGDLRSTTMASTSAPTAFGGGPSWALVLLLGVAVAGGGAGAAYLVLRERKPAPEAAVGLGIDDYVQLAYLAAEGERYGEALDWVRKARALAPTSARLCLDEGFFLASLGEVDAALECYARASNLTDEGEPDLAAARLKLVAQDLADATVLAASALQKSPELVLELDELFDALEGRPAFDRAVRVAFRALERQERER